MLTSPWLINRFAQFVSIWQKLLQHRSGLFGATWHSCEGLTMRPQEAAATCFRSFLWHFKAAQWMRSTSRRETKQSQIWSHNAVFTCHAFWLIPNSSLEGCFNCYSNNVALQKHCALWLPLLTLSRRECRQGLHAALNELAPQDIEVVSVKENCTAYQTVTIRSHILRNDPLHLRLDGERQRERWSKVCRGADSILQLVFWSDKHEVKIPSPPAGLHSNLHFLSISISHCCHLKNSLLFPVLYLLFLSTFHLHLHFPPTLHLLRPPSNHCSNLTPSCQYLCGQVSKYH